MKHICHLLFLLIFLLSFQNSAADGKRALKLLEKQDYEKLVDYLDKSIAKDSISPGIKYVYSLLYLDSAFSRFNIDSSYYFIDQSIDDLKYLDEKDLKKLNKDGINDSIIHVQKSEVERASFKRSKMEHSLSSYNYFIENYQEAIQIDSAIYYRNEIGYQQAVETNTYQAFRNFIYTYPDAIQIEEAKSNYEKLLFNTMTTDGQLQTYIRFVKNNPSSPHRAEAERNILEIAAADNQMESYVWFLEKYPNSRHSKKAKNFLYHRFKENYSGQEALNKFRFLYELDSLREIVELEKTTLFPVYENGKYAFFNTRSDRVIDFLFDSVSADLLCGNITSDILEVFRSDQKMIISLNGFEIYRGSFDEFTDLGSGLVKIKLEDKYGIVHKTGIKLFDFQYKEIELLSHSFLKLKKEDKWGLMSVMGRQILPFEYDEIEAEEDFFAIKKGEFYAISNVSTLKRAAQGDDLNLFFSYDDYFLIDDLHLVAISGEKEALIDKDLKIISKLEDHTIHPFFDGWIEKSSKGYRLYDLIYHPYSGEYYEKVLTDSKKLAFQLKGLWGVYLSGTDFTLELDYDSVQFLSDNITLLFRDQAVKALFHTDTLVSLVDFYDIKLLRPQSGITDLKNAPSYLVAKDKRDVYHVFNDRGEEIIKGKYDQIEAIGPEYLVVTRNGKKGLFLSNGKELLGIKYQGFGNYQDGYLSTMLNNKFGVYHYKDDLLLSAKHDKTLRYYGKEYFVSNNNEQFAFVNKENDFITDFEFDQVNYWSDTIALVKSKDYWKLFDIKHKNTAYDKIDVYEKLIDTPDETIILITKEGQVGLLSNTRGEIIGPTFNDIYNVGTKETPLFFAEKYIPEAEFYIVIYYDKNGEVIRKQVFDENEYWKIYCD